MSRIQNFGHAAFNLRGTANLIEVASACVRAREANVTTAQLRAVHRGLRSWTDVDLNDFTDKVIQLFNREISLSGDSRQVVADPAGRLIQA